MRRRQRRRLIDKRLNWRDPKMPALRLAQDNLTGEISLEVVPPEVITEVAEFDLANTDEPDWKDDPTYNLFTRKRRI